jgi:hypothetical protein
MGMADTLLLGRKIPPSAGAPLTPAAADQYMQLLATANVFQLMSNKDATTRKKLSVFDRFSSFMAGLGRSVLQATPQDVKVFLTHWSLTSGRYAVGLWHCVAPVSAQCVISYLATEMDRFPMTSGPWEGMLARGAPLAGCGFSSPPGCMWVRAGWV